jgi:type IV pilus assembly protein PilV
MKKQSGFSMLEVLVSLVIVMIGALGMAGIQMLSISNTETARYQSLAAILASSMTAEIQGNKAYWGTAPTGISVTGGAVSGGPSASTVAGNSLQTWATSIASVLPSATGTVSCSGTPAICTVRLQWTENNVALNKTTGTETGTFAAGQQGAQRYQTMVTVR